MQPSKRLRARDVERLENTSIVMGIFEVGQANDCGCTPTCECTDENCTLITCACDISAACCCTVGGSTMEIRLPALEVNRAE